jgi:hypothetical protein
MAKSSSHRGLTHLDGVLYLPPHRMPRRVRSLALLHAVTGFALLAGACSDTSGLPAAGIENKIDTVSLYALSSTPIQSPSAYRLTGSPAAVRTDQSSQFDFAFDFDTGTGRPVFKPTEVLGLGRSSALGRATLAFDLIKSAPSGGWVYDSALVADSGRVLLVRSRPTTCFTGITVSLYAKLEVLAVDTSSAPGGRRIDFRILVDENCGYRGLEPGLPKR